MAFLEYLLFFVIFSILVMIIYRHDQKQTTTLVPTNWPILGMIPGILVNAHRLHDYTTQILIQTNRATVMFKGPWFANMDTLLTTDPSDIHHILSQNFTNYPKGDKVRNIFDVLGDGILNSDGKTWEINHKIIFSTLKHAGFRSKMETVIWNKVENGLLPVLESICGTEEQADLQDIFQRFAFDTVCTLLFDNDPESLCLDFPYIPCSKAFTDGEEAILLRHVTPPFFWKLQQFLGVGKEKKLKDAWKNLDQFIQKCLDETQNHEAADQKFIFFTVIKREFRYQSETVSVFNPTRFLRDTLVNLMAAGKDTISSSLSWFFYLLARNPTVEDKILEEIRTRMEADDARNTKELDEMVYLHAALCETLRLYPPVPFSQKSPVQPDILPSGHQIDQNTNVILSFYSMGRMESIWGEDCAEFKPERWIDSNSGGIKHEPSYKFVAFGAGPRACLGKNMALAQMKIVSTTIIRRYRIQVVEGHPVLPADSMILQMKHGLKVILTRRNELN